MTRLRPDARLFAPPPPRVPGTIGRPRLVGPRRPSLAQRLSDPRARWRRVAVGGWYGGAERLVESAAGTAVWHHPGLPVVPLRSVLGRDPAGAFRPQAFLCTDLTADPLDILSWFVRRWATEVTFEEARRHPGVETQRQWSDQAMARTTPALLGLCSLVALWADEIPRARRLVPRSAGWYDKRRATFGDALAAVRRTLWVEAHSFSSASGCDTAKVPRAALDRLTDLACYAA